MTTSQSSRTCYYVVVYKVFQLVKIKNLPLKTYQAKQVKFYECCINLFKKKKTFVR